MLRTFIFSRVQALRDQRVAPHTFHLTFSVAIISFRYTLLGRFVGIDKWLISIEGIHPLRPHRHINSVWLLNCFQGKQFQGRVGNIFRTYFCRCLNEQRRPCRSRSRSHYLLASWTRLQDRIITFVSWNFPIIDSPPPIVNKICLEKLFGKCSVCSVFSLSLRRLLRDRHFFEKNFLGGLTPTLFYSTPFLRSPANVSTFN